MSIDGEVVSRTVLPPYELTAKSMLLLHGNRYTSSPRRRAARQEYAHRAILSERSYWNASHCNARITYTAGHSKRKASESAVKKNSGSIDAILDGLTPDRKEIHSASNAPATSPPQARP